MSSLPLITIAGESDSGKTDLVVDLVSDFVEDGFKVCTIKHSPGEFKLDEKGKDTWRHCKAGSRFTVFSTEVETSFLFSKKMELKEIENTIERMGECDLVIAEGYKDSAVPKIVVGNHDYKNTIIKYDNNISEVRNKIRDLIKISYIEEDLPGLDCGRCGHNNCNEFAKAVFRGNEDLSDCEVRGQDKVDLKVNGEEVPLEYFPARFIEGGLKGMLRALKGVDDEIKRVSLEIRN